MKHFRRLAALVIMTVTLFASAFPVMASASYVVKDGVLQMTDFPGMKGTVYCKEYKVGGTFYTYDKTGKHRTTGGGLYYVKIGKKYEYVAGAQCLAYARYLQEKLYGVNDGVNSNKFRSVGSLPASKMTASSLKKLIKRGGRGAHLRTSGKQHSFFVLKVTDDYFTVADANGNGGSGKIAIKKYTYKAYANSGWGKRGIAYLNVKK